jgi:hypothetical protein
MFNLDAACVIVLPNNERLKVPCFKAGNNCWLDNVSNKWEKYLYQEAFNRKNKAISTKVEYMLVDHKELGNLRTWVSLGGLDVCFGMEE